MSTKFSIDLGVDCFSLTFLDHLPIFSIHFDASISTPNETVFVRDVNQVNTTKFLSHLERIDWSQYATLDDPNNAYNSFFKQYSTAYDSCFP